MNINENNSKSKSKPRNPTVNDYICRDVVTFEKLQRMIIMDDEIIKLMSSRLLTYTDLYLKFFQSQLSYSTPK